MLAISPYTGLSSQIDTLRVLTDSTLSVQQVQSAKMDSVCDAIARFSDGQGSLYGKIDSIQTQIQTISENGVGYSDVLGHIAIPLIIALFAFAFTYSSPLLPELMRSITPRTSVECLRRVHPIGAICGDRVSVSGISSLWVLCRCF